ECRKNDEYPITKTNRPGSTGTSACARLHRRKRLCHRSTQPPVTWRTCRPLVIGDASALASRHSRFPRSVSKPDHLAQPPSCSHPGALTLFALTLSPCRSGTAAFPLAPCGIGAGVMARWNRHFCLRRESQAETPVPPAGLAACDMANIHPAGHREPIDARELELALFPEFFQT